MAKRKRAAKTILKAASAKYLNYGKNKGRAYGDVYARQLTKDGIQRGKHLSKNVTRFACQAYGPTQLLNDHCYPKGKGYTQNIGQQLLTKPRKLPRANRAVPATAKTIAIAAGFGLGRSTKRRSTSKPRSSSHLSTWTSHPDKLGSFADKSRDVAESGMS
jgi:hypothetical protein